MYKLELAKFMHKLFKNMLPNTCNYDFSTIEKIHDYETRRPSRSNYFYLEFLNLLGKRGLNSGVLNCRTILNNITVQTAQIIIEQAQLNRKRRVAKLNVNTKKNI